MNEKDVYSLSYEFSEEGAAATEQALRNMGAVFNELVAAVPAGTTAFEKFAAKLAKVENKLNTSTSSVSKSTAEWSKFAEEVRKANAELQVSSQSGTLPGGGANASSAGTTAVTATTLDSSLPKQSQEVKQLSSSYDTLTKSVNGTVGARKADSKASSEQTEALKDTQKAADGFTGSLPTMRYALYDVAQTMGVVSGGLTAAGVGVVAVAAQYESAFTAVERTSGVTGTAVDELRGDFLKLSREIPQSFAEIANIGARGAQLGVATEDLKQFTETVAQFVATSDTVSLGEAVEAFGRISNLLGDTDFNRIGSAITLVGVNAAATEAQIVKTTQELAPFATAVGMSSDEVIGLAAALGSLGQPPERARSAFLTLQRVMDTAITSGSDNLEQFGNLLGKTADETARLWKQDPGEFIKAFADGLGHVDDLTGAFAALGINERRAVQVFQALASDARNANGELSVLSQAMQDSAQGYAEGTELARQYALILDDLASKWQLLKNSLGELVNEIGVTLAPLMGKLLDIVTQVTQALTNFAQTPFGKVLIVSAGAVGALVAGLTGLLSVMALAGASILALASATQGFNLEAGKSLLSIGGLRVAFGQLGAAAGITATQIKLIKTALISTGIGAAVVALGTLANAFIATADSATVAQNTLDKYLTDTSGFSDAIAQDMQAYNEAIASGNTDAINSFVKVSSEMEKVSSSSTDMSNGVKSAAQVLGVEAPNAINSTSKALQDQSYYLGENARAWITSSLLQSEAFQKLSTDGDFVDSWIALGADFQEVITIAAEEGSAGVMRYFRVLAESSEAGSQAYLKGFPAFMSRLGTTFKALGRFIGSAWKSIFSLGPNKTEMGEMAASVLEIGAVWTNPVFKSGYRDIANTVSALTSFDRTTAKAAKTVADAGPEFEGLGDNLDKAGDSAKRAKEELRSVSDYANDLKTVFGRAFELQFGVQQSQDSTTKIFQQIRKEAEEAQKRIRDLRQEMRSLRAEISGLQAQISEQKYFLSIAMEYGDSKRAEQIQANLIKLQADLAGKQKDLTDKNKELTKAQQANSKTLTGNSEQAIKNRETMASLVQSYEAQLVALANSGASQEEVRKKSEQLRADFVRQATQLGFNRNEVKKYEDSLRQMTQVINQIPRKVSTSMEIKGLGAATAAIKEFQTKANHALKSVENQASKTGKAVKGAGGSIPFKANLDTSQMTRALDQMAASFTALAATFSGSPLQGLYRMQANAMRSAARSIRGFYDGGFVGTGGKYEPKGIVHGGEYVFRKDQVNQTTGLPTMDALGRMMMAQPGFRRQARASSVQSSAPGVVDLTAGTIHAIAQAVQPYLVVGDEVIGGAASRSNAHDSSVGRY